MIVDNKDFALALILLAIVAGCICFLALYLYSAANARADKLDWCWKEYTAIDRAIVTCINSQNFTLEYCLQPWNQKDSVIRYGNCPGVLG